ncbi:MAG: hypothetical protein F6J86_38885 [Symploca sp. SIO1B1]|nr:hypothetical protein [Symploca sp. SIO1B1]
MNYSELARSSNLPQQVVFPSDERTEDDVQRHKVSDLYRLEIKLLA